MKAYCTTACPPKARDAVVVEPDGRRPTIRSSDARRWGKRAGNKAARAALKRELEE